MKQWTGRALFEMSNYGNVELLKVPRCNIIFIITAEMREPMNRFTQTISRPNIHTIQTTKKAAEHYTNMYVYGIERYP